ncbi:hypothetical protein L1987_23047 [Smallanthus sonchifolius]|uniref:Uncharacterized protein n=1 Tax=Smallanthus sonchifolius TaxID=185202 RepID=A0ACB9IHW8_9ASTR|nr:hypothetical protein L1987_23047 [Smallanthus sonchifolius]
MDSQRYDELHGSNNWAGLLDPLDLDLRNLVLGYGDLSSAARAFNKDEGSLYKGYSHYGKSSFFKGVMLPWADSKYQVTAFIYPTAHVNSIPPLLDPGMSQEGSEFDSNWMGYVAVSTDDYSKFIGRREICVVWRGMETLYELIDGIAGAEPVPADSLLQSANSTDTDTDTPQVMGGWLTIYNTSDPNSEFIPSSARTQLLEHMKDLLGKMILTSSRFGFIFACPQVGNQSFKSMMEELPNLKVLRVKNDPDIIPFWPSKILKWISENVWENVPSELLGYVDVVIEILIDTKKSPYLKNEGNPFVAHDLQGMLHALSGWNGKDGDFDWALLKRSLGLANMSTDLLKKEYKIPVNWWAEKNKGMVLNEYGDWVLSPLDRRDHDLPV